MTTQRRFGAPTAKAELFALLVVGWLAFAAVPIRLGGIGLSWDALNHHVYLGWIASQPRFERDFLAASYQSFQYPYLYWPLYRLFAAGWGGVPAGIVLVSMNLLAVPPLWMMARACIPEWGWYGMAMRWLGVVLAFLTGAVLSLFDSTSNDLLAAVPLIWAVALGLQPMTHHEHDTCSTKRLVVLSGFCAGVAVAFKLSNGPLAILLPALWVLHGSSMRQRMAYATFGSIATVAGFLLLYGWWGWQMWVHYGNPIYPFYDHMFDPLRRWWGFR